MASLTKDSTKEDGMSEAEWLACTDPERLFMFLLGRIPPDGLGLRHGGVAARMMPGVTERKLRLYACAGCRRLWPLLKDERSQRAVETAELLADGAVDESMRKKDQWEAEDAVEILHRESIFSADISSLSGLVMSRPRLLAASAALLALRDTHESVRTAIGAVLAVGADWGDQSGAKELFGPEVRLALLRDIFGNPMGQAVLEPEWLTATVKGIAASAYHERTDPAGILEHDRLLILADALEDAGCSDPAILEHLRGPGLHVRGCVVIDLLLGNY
jgi:hypothetical protein